MSFTAEQVRLHQQRHGFADPLAPAKAVEVEEPDDFKEPANAFPGPEKILHVDFARDMGRRGVYVSNSRMNKAATTEPGTPDFLCMYTPPECPLGLSRCCAIEFKVSGGVVKPSQRAVIADLRQKRIPVLVAWSLADAIRFARATLGC